MNRPLFPPPASFPLIHPLDAVIRPRLTLRRLLNIENKNVQKIPCGLCVCVVLCVCPSALVQKSPNVTVCIPDERAQKPEIFPGIPLPCLLRFSYFPRGRSGAFSNPCCSDTGERRLLRFPFLPLPALCSGAQSRVQGFFPVRSPPPGKRLTRC